MSDDWDKIEAGFVAPEKRDKAVAAQKARKVECRLQATPLHYIYIS